MLLQEWDLKSVFLEQLVASIIESTRRNGTTNMDSKPSIQSFYSLIVDSVSCNFDYK
jgi:hypothetical protein